jgi:hypothetical protein
MLGVWLVADGSDMTKMKVILDRMKKFVANLCSATLTRDEAYLAYYAMLKPALEYCLGSTAFMRDQCDEIERSYHSHVLRKMGNHGTTALAIVHGPLKYGGLGFESYWTAQGVQHTLLLVGHW